MSVLDLGNKEFYDTISKKLSPPLKTWKLKQKENVFLGKKVCKTLLFFIVVLYYFIVIIILWLFAKHVLT